MAKSKIMQCKIITPEGPVFEHDAVSVVLPAQDGQVGILADHCPMILLLGTGQMSLESPARGRLSGGEGDRYYMPIYGGFAEINQNRLTVLAEETGKLIKAGRRGRTTEDYDD